MSSYHINCNNCNINLSDTLRSLQDYSEMSDVTLAVEGMYFKSHQIILSMFSSYFKELFRVTPSRNTIFFMKNVKHTIMKNLLDYIYAGNVEIPSGDIQLFLETAKELKINGLMDSSCLNQENAVETRETLVNNESSRRFSETEPPAKRMKPENSTDNTETIIKNQETQERETVTTNSSEILETTPILACNQLVKQEMKAIDNERECVKCEDLSPSISSESTIPDSNDGINNNDVEDSTTNHTNSILSSNDPGVTQGKETQKTEDIEIGPTVISGLTISNQNDCNALNSTELPTNSSEANNSNQNIGQWPESRCVTIKFYKTVYSMKIKQCVWNNYRYIIRYERNMFTRWACASRGTEQCKARLITTKNDFVTLVQEHNHSENHMKGKMHIFTSSRVLIHLSSDDFTKKFNVK